jgi:hypothetical protein
MRIYTSEKYKAKLQVYTLTDNVNVKVRHQLQVSTEKTEFRLSDKWPNTFNFDIF